MAGVKQAGYTGHVAEWLEGFLAKLKHHGFLWKVSNGQGKTIRVDRGDTPCGYINPTVLQKKGVLGYHFGRHWGTETNSDSCPPAHVDELVSSFCSRYQCRTSDVVAHKGAGSNKHRTFLIIKNNELALRVLLQDAGLPHDDSMEVIEVDGHYVEGRLVDVRMTRHERSAAARRACLGEYGFDCFVCRANLKRQYGLPVQVIHVHHEEPMSGKTGPRKVDPTKDMKPVCANCHAVIHSRTPMYSIQEVREMLRRET